VPAVARFLQNLPHTGPKKGRTRKNLLEEMEQIIL
jgi:hypothetical protein